MTSGVASDDPEADVHDPAHERFYGSRISEGDPEALDTYDRQKRDKVLEVIRQYDPDAVYFDGGASRLPDRYRRQILSELYRTDGNPDAIVTYKGEDFPEGTGCRDLECTRFEADGPWVWQNDDRLEANVTWCIVEDPRFKSAHRIIQHLCDVVSKNGNLLLNLGPNADGSWPEEARRVLFDVGRWLDVNGEAIYGTRPFSVYGEGPRRHVYSLYGAIKMHGRHDEGIVHDSTIGMLGDSDVRFTRSKDGRTVYAILQAWPSDGTARVRALRCGGAVGRIGSVRLLGHARSLAWEQTNESLQVRLPRNRPSDHACSLAVAADPA